MFRRKFIIAMTSLVALGLSGCTDDGEKYVGEWKRIGTNRKVVIERNGKTFTLLLERTMKWSPKDDDFEKFPASIDANGLLEFNAGLGKATASVDEKTGHLILAGAEYERVK